MGKRSGKGKSGAGKKGKAGRGQPKTGRAEEIGNKVAIEVNSRAVGFIASGLGGPVAGKVATTGVRKVMTAARDRERAEETAMTHKQYRRKKEKETLDHLGGLAF